MTDINTQSGLERKVLAPVEQPAIVFHDGSVMRKAMDGNYTIEPKESYFGPKMEKALKITTGIFVSSGIIALCVGEYADSLFLGIGGAATYISYRFGRNAYSTVFSEKEKNRWIVTQDKTPFREWPIDQARIPYVAMNYAKENKN